MVKPMPSCNPVPRHHRPVWRSMMRRRNSLLCGGADGGVATVWAAISISALLALSGTLFLLGTASVTRHRAAHAADLAALAASARIGAGPQAGCAAASSVVTETGGQLRQREWRGSDALVSVETVTGG